jgi:hypothetical protein
VGHENILEDLVGKLARKRSFGRSRRRRTDVYVTKIRGAQIFKKSTNNGKILETRRMT